MLLVSLVNVPHSARAIFSVTSRRLGASTKSPSVSERACPTLRVSIPLSMTLWQSRESRGSSTVVRCGGNRTIGDPARASLERPCHVHGRKVEDVMDV